MNRSTRSGTPTDRANGFADRLDANSGSPMFHSDHKVLFIELRSGHRAGFATVRQSVPRNGLRVNLGCFRPAGLAPEIKDRINRLSMESNVHDRKSCNSSVIELH